MSDLVEMHMIGAYVRELEAAGKKPPHRWWSGPIAMQIAVLQDAWHKAGLK